jgi:hypothetical protein
MMLNHPLLVLIYKLLVNQYSYQTSMFNKLNYVNSFKSSKKEKEKKQRTFRFINTTQPTFIYNICKKKTQN